MNLKKTIPSVGGKLMLAALSSALLVHQGIAEEATELQPMVVTASRLPEPINKAAASIEKITKEDLFERQNRTLPESLSEVSGVHVQKTSYGQGSPYIRGFTGFHALMLVDGIRLNSPVFRGGPNQYWNTVDSFSLDGMELLKGPGSVLYGSDAVGGTLQAFTRLPDFAPEGEEDWGVRLNGRVASAERSVIGRAEGTYATDDMAALIGITGKNFGDLEGGHHVGRQRKTGYDELNYDAKLRLSLAGDRELILAWMSVDQEDIWRTHRTPYGISWHGTTVGKEPIHRFNQDHDLGYIRLIDREATGLYDTLQATIYHQRQKEAREVQKKELTSEKDGFDVRTFGAMADMVKETSIGTWAYGAEYIYDKIDSFRNKYDEAGRLKSVEIQGAVADNSYYHTAALYLQDRIALAKDWELTAGARATYAKADIGRYENFETTPHTPGAFEDDWNNLSGHLRLSYQVVENWLLYSSVSQAYRAPGLSDLTSFNVNRSTDIAIPSPSLDPEKFLGYEIGSEVSGETLAWHLAFFYTDIRDRIVAHAAGGDYYTNANAGEGYVQGIETEVKIRLAEQWTSRLGFTWMEGYSDYRDVEGEAIHEPIRTMPITSFASLRWQKPNRRVWAEAVVRAVDKEDRLTASDKRDTQRLPGDGTPGYVVGDVRCGLRLNDGLSMVAGIDNIADKDYRIHGSGSNEAGRNFIFSTEYRF